MTKITIPKHLQYKRIDFSSNLKKFLKTITIVDNQLEYQQFEEYVNMNKFVKEKLIREMLVRGFSFGSKSKSLNIPDFLMNNNIYIKSKNSTIHFYNLLKFLSIDNMKDDFDIDNDLFFDYLNINSFFLYNKNLTIKKIKLNLKRFGFSIYTNKELKNKLKLVKKLYKNEAISPIVNLENSEYLSQEFNDDNKNDGLVRELLTENKSLKKEIEISYQNIERLENKIKKETGNLLLKPSNDNSDSDDKNKTESKDTLTSSSEVRTNEFNDTGEDISDFFDEEKNEDITDFFDEEHSSISKVTELEIDINTNDDSNSLRDVIKDVEDSTNDKENEQDTDISYTSNGKDTITGIKMSTDEESSNIVIQEFEDKIKEFFNTEIGELNNLDINLYGKLIKNGINTYVDFLNLTLEENFINKDEINTVSYICNLKNEIINKYKALLRLFNKRKNNDILLNDENNKEIQKIYLIPFISGNTLLALEEYNKKTLYDVFNLKFQEVDAWESIDFANKNLIKNDLCNLKVNILLKKEPIYGFLHSIFSRKRLANMNVYNNIKSYVNLLNEEFKYKDETFKNSDLLTNLFNNNSFQQDNFIENKISNLKTKVTNLVGFINLQVKMTEKDNDFGVDLLDPYYKKHFIFNDKMVSYCPLDLYDLLIENGFSILEDIAILKYNSKIFHIENPDFRKKLILLGVIVRMKKY